MKHFAIPLLVLAINAALAGGSLASTKALPPRQVVLLDGTWEIGEGPMDAAPEQFSHKVAVPGLVDMAEPAFADVGRKSDRRAAFWYRRTFRLDGPLPEIALLKIHKARYGMKVFVNGQAVGESLSCFTPEYFDVRRQLRGEGRSNELMVRVGADRECIPPDVPSGWDFEKYLYIPGIYDSVELILSGTPYLVNVQAVPEIDARQVRVVAEVRLGDAADGAVLEAQAFEAVSEKTVGSAKARVTGQPGEVKTLELAIPIQDCRLWSPEDPFLYELRLATGGDAMSTRFGMRSFRFDPQSKRAILNGKPYFLRGSNVCIYRFFEDAERGDLPWRADWVRRFHQRLKSVHWNSLRYCIGFPPELWYDIADEEGWLIQDEFPIWLLGKAPEDPKAEKIIPQYTAWMRERWNHPCVVIWDAQNESHTEETGKALEAVRHLDLSNRPWENGWAAPQCPTDCVESHPYLFSRGWSKGEPFRLEEMVEVSGVPRLQPRQKELDVPIVINEYCWLWLNRDGSTTCLTGRVYESLLGPESTAGQRRMLRARYVAALTEFWRCHRQCAGVLHFCSLGYSRDGSLPRPEGGATSDDFIDLERLVFEPLFAEHVGEAFNPLGLMLDFWNDALPCGARRALEVYVINDRDEAWHGDVRLRIVQNGKTLSVRSQPCEVPALGREILTIRQTAPEAPGDYQIVAELTDPSGKTVRSLRDFKARAE